MHWYQPSRIDDDRVSIHYLNLGSLPLYILGARSACSTRFPSPQVWNKRKNQVEIEKLYPR